MALEEKIVSDSNGNSTDTESRNIVGTIQAKDVYTFYVQGAQNDGGGYEHSEVKMVLPVGGNLSGIYRFPRVGEKVLVDGNYLLGYIPGEGTIPFAPVGDDLKTVSEEKKRLTDHQGMILRYEQTGKKEPEAGEAYSEIGFYHQATSWKLTHKNKGDYKNTAEDAKANIYPKIDRINIQSTGDLHSKAENHHRIMAKRFELLADCPEIDYKTAKDSEGNLPLGDVPGDDSQLHSGDVHIRAGNRVVIKADDEIQLKVGRTTLTLSDKGFEVVTKRIDSNWETSFDTSLSLNPRNGISMFGQGVDIASGHKLTLGDSLGGEVSITTGVTSVSGREVHLESADASEYKWLMAFNALDLAMNTTLVSLAKAGVDPSTKKGYEAVDLGIQFARKIYEVCKTIIDGYRDISRLSQKKKKEQQDQRQAALQSELQALEAQKEQAIQANKSQDETDKIQKQIDTAQEELNQVKKTIEKDRLEKEERELQDTQKELAETEKGLNKTEETLKETKEALDKDPGRPGAGGTKAQRDAYGEAKARYDRDNAQYIADKYEYESAKTDYADKQNKYEQGKQAYASGGTP